MLTASDAELASRTAEGDNAAFALLYERYMQGSYDLALRMLHDREAAGDVVQTSFMAALEELRRGKTFQNPRAWLYATVRNGAIDRLRHERRQARGQDGEGSSVGLVSEDELPSSSPEASAEQAELAELVWQAAAALSPRDYSVLDLYVRKGLTADELADALGLRKGAVYTLLSRLRDSLEEAVTYTLLLRRGRRECAELDALLTVSGATELRPQIRRAIRDHVRHCAGCQERVRRYVSPDEIFSIIATLPLAGERDRLHPRVAGRLDVRTGASAIVGTPPSWPAVVRPAARLSRRAFGLAVVIAAAASAVAVVGFPRGELTALSDPPDLHSTSHEVGRSSSEEVVRVAWSAPPAASGYSVLWTEDSGALPDTVADLPGSAIGAISQPLPDGAWYFALRTGNAEGRWTNGVRIGPFLIQSAPTRGATQAPTSSPSPTEAPPSPSLTAPPLPATPALPTAPPALPTAPPAPAATAPAATQLPALSPKAAPTITPLTPSPTRTSAPAPIPVFTAEPREPHEPREAPAPPHEPPPRPAL